MTKKTYGVFGIYRWLMATMVIVAHLGPQVYSYCGAYAVFAFFTLSGYIVTYILRTHYFGLEKGLRKYYLNRALRVYPSYWAVMALTIPLLMRFPEAARSMHGLMVLPENGRDWLTNISTLGLSSVFGQLYPHVIVPPAWSLGVEIVWWLFMPLMVRNIPSIICMSLLTAAFAAYMIADTLPLGDSYFNICYYSPLTGMIAFVCGALAYFRKEWGVPDMPLRLTLLAIGVQTLIFFNAWVLFANPNKTGFWLAIPISFFAVYALSGFEPSRLPDWLRKCDFMLGELSYLIFLVHMPAAVVLKVLVPSLPFQSWTFFIPGLIAANLLALLFFHVLEIPLRRLRSRVRH